MIYLKLHPKQWVILSIIQIILAVYFFSNIQTYLVYQTLPRDIFGNLGFNQFIIGTLFSDAFLLFILSLPFLNNNYSNNFKFLSFILILLIAMSLSLNTSGNINYHYLIYLTIAWFLFGSILLFIYLKFNIKSWFVHFILVSILSIAWLKSPFHWTTAPLQQIPNETKALLSKINKPLEIKAFISNSHPFKQRLSDFIANYQYFNPLIKLSFISPQSAPAQIKAFSIEQEGELLLQYEGQLMRVEKITDHAFTEALQRLLNLNKTKLIFLEGHGERALQNNSPFDFSKISLLLQNKSIEALSQAFLPDINRETLLVIAHPRQPLNIQENKELIKYIENGGNLLWLIEPALENDGLSGLNQLARYLGLKLLDGRLWDDRKTDNPTLIETNQFSTLENMQGLPVIFPEVAALQIEQTAFKIQPFLTTSGISLKSFDNKKLQENQSAFNIGFTLERTINNQTQRIVMIGDSDFMSNAYIEKNNNAKLTIEIMNWLTESTDLIKVAAQKNYDMRLTLDFNLQMILTAFFLFVLPLVFIIMGYKTSKIGASK
jgi:hypothetical protein